ncbi:MAG: hypothetical protein QOF89_3043 [Acidobacteriota bacterium]|jgi:hypothetical protein|nr:hypothetical protein [Acidobacteriota bacterium]
MAREGFHLRWLAAAALLAALALPGVQAQGARGEDVSDKVDARIAFHLLQGLAGDWTGTAGKDIPATVTYRVGSNGTIVTEMLFPGTDHEMMTVYYLEGKNLVANHYCAVGNQPHYKLDTAKSTLKELVFAFDGGTNLEPNKDTHVHDGRIAFVDKDKLEASWSAYAGGEKRGSHDFHLTRAAGKQPAK